MDKRKCFLQSALNLGNTSVMVAHLPRNSPVEIIFSSSDATGKAFAELEEVDGSAVRAESAQHRIADRKIGMELACALRDTKLHESLRIGTKQEKLNEAPLFIFLLYLPETFGWFKRGRNVGSSWR